MEYEKIDDKVYEKKEIDLPFVIEVLKKERETLLAEVAVIDEKLNALNNL